MSETDATRLLDYYKDLGPKFNDSLMARARVNPKQTLDRMIGASFPITQEKLDHRKSLKIVVEEVDGPVSEIAETRK